MAIVAQEASCTSCSHRLRSWRHDPGTGCYVRGEVASREHSLAFPIICGASGRQSTGEHSHRRAGPACRLSIGFSRDTDVQAPAVCYEWRVSRQPPAEAVDRGSDWVRSESQVGVAGGADPDPGARSARPPVGSLLLKASATVMLQGGSLAMGFATTVLLARLLGGDGYGRYVLALTWASLLTIPAILGLDRFLVRGIATYDVYQKWQLMKGLLRRANQFVLLSSLAITGIGWMVAVLWLAPSLGWPFCVAMLLVPLTALTLLRQAAMQAIGRVVSGQLPEYVIRPALILVGIGVLEFVGNGVLTSTTALAANVIGVAVAFIVGAVMLNRALPAEMSSARPEYETSVWIRASLPMMLISGVWMANSYVTTLLVGTLDGTRAAGVYSVVQKGAELIVVLLIATNMPLAPAIARMYARKDRQGLQHATERVAQLTFLVSAPIAVAFMIFPGTYLRIFGPSFQVGATGLTIIAFAQLINAAAGPAGNVLLMTGWERVAVRGVGAGLIVNVVLGVALIPQLGVTGGAIAFAASLVLWNSALALFARQRVGINVTAVRRLAVSSPSTHSEVSGP